LGCNLKVSASSAICAYHSSLAESIVIQEKGAYSLALLSRKPVVFTLTPFPPARLILHRKINLSLKIDIQGEMFFTYSHQQSA